MIKELNQKVDRITEALQLLAIKVEHDAEKAESEREKQQLRLENILLKAERRMLPDVPKHNDENEAVKAQVEALQSENEELRQRLEQLEKETKPRRTRQQ